METHAGALKEIVINKEDAVFWMDGNGHWCNRHGRFQHKKIIDYFNAAINRDGSGFYVEQINGDTREKVYFRYEETAFFAVALKMDEPPALTLNTGIMIPLRVSDLFVVGDKLYHYWSGHFVKFTERLLLDVADVIDSREGSYFFRDTQRWHMIKEFGDIVTALKGA